MMPLKTGSHAVCAYSKSTQIRSTALQLDTENYSDAMDEVIVVHTCIYIPSTLLHLLGLPSTTT